MPIPDVLQGGAAGIVVGVVYLILQGFLVPRRVLQDVQRERDEWRSLALSAMNQNGQLLQGARVVNDVLQAIPHPTNSGVPEK